MSPYQVFQFGQFGGGLNLRDKTDVVTDSQAIDLLNVDFTDVGAIRQRDGYVELTGSALTNRVDSLAAYYKADGTKQLLAGCGTRLEGINTSGAVIDSETGLTGGPYTFCRFAAPGAETAYAGNGSDTLRKWDGSTWTAPTATVNGVAARAMPEAGVICLMANSNRMVATGFGTNTAGGPHALPSNPSQVYFSDVQNPESWTAGDGLLTGNWINFDPGDGEQVMGAVTWRNFTFVFKESKYFVITGERTQDGITVFDYYTVATGVGLAARGAVTVAREGVYFMSRQGVYFTNGPEPQLLSDLVDPIWRGNPSSYYLSGVLNHAQIALSRLTWHDERLYLSIPTGSATANDRTFVFDTGQRWWTLYDVPMSASVSFRRGNSPELHFGYASGGNEIGYMSIDADADNTAVITSRWRSGWSDYSTGQMKRLRESKLWGSGGVTVQFTRDFRGSAESQFIVPVVFGSLDDVWADGSDPTDVWGDGTDPTDLWQVPGEIGSTLVRKAIRGTVFSTQFSNLSGYASWSVHRVSRHLAGQKIPTTLGVDS